MSHNDQPIWRIEDNIPASKLEMDPFLSDQNIINTRLISRSRSLHNHFATLDEFMIKYFLRNEF